MGISRELVVLVDAAELVKPRLAIAPNLLAQRLTSALYGDMQFHRARYFFAAIGAVLFLSVTSDLRACACCSDPGEYTLRNDDTVGKYQVDQIHGMKFAPAAELYVTDAGAEEDAKGINSVSDSYGLSVATEASVWRLTFRAENGKSGVLTLPFPSKMTTYAADIHDGKKSEGNGPLLYKEWRFEGKVTGDGIFAEGLKSPARYILIFQGRGNRCDNAEDFMHWRLAISGKKTHYAFQGELITATTESR